MLGDAIAAADWPHALGLALDAWRGSRSPALADLIDALSAHLAARPPASWMAAALAYSPVAASALVRRAHLRVRRCDSEWPALVARLGEDDPVLARIRAVAPDAELPRHQRNRIERLCAFARWPADPRVATVLATWLLNDAFSWEPPFGDAVVVLEIIADELVRIGDARIVPALRTSLERPRGPTPALRAHQQRIARRILDDMPPAPPDDPGVVAWLAALAPPAADAEALWCDVLADPDAIAPRLVLADYLQERGDTRGQLIALQCTEQRPSIRGSTVIHEGRDRWLGDLALVLDLDASTFEHGMLALAVIGLRTTPEWAYAASIGHRELALATTVRIRRATAAQAAPLVAGQSAARPLALERVPLGTVGVFAAARARLPIRRLTFGGGTCTPEELATDLARGAAWAPALEEVTFENWSLGLAPALRMLHHVPRLVVAVRSYAQARAELDLVAHELPQLEIVETT